MRGRSKLDGYFSASVTAVDLVPVDDPVAEPTDRSQGAVTRGETLWRDRPVAGGFFDPAIFGPLDGSLAHWGHLEVAGGVTIAGTRITKIPIPPIADRMPRVVDDPLARARWHGRINDAWIALLEAIRSHDRLAELGMPAAMIAADAIHLQHHFEDVVAVMRGEEPSSHHGHDHAHDEHAHDDHAHGNHADRYTMMPCPAVEPAVPLAMLFLDEDRILIQSTGGCRIVDREGRSVGAPWTPTGPTASSVHGDLVVFGGHQRDVWRRRAYPDSVAWPEDASHRAPFAAYDLAARTWVMLVDERFPAWVVDETDVAGADAHELATGETHDLVAGAQRGMQLAQTRDGRFALLAVVGAADDHAFEPDALDYALVIVEVATQRPFVCVPDSPASLPLVRRDPDSHSDASVPDSPAAWRVDRRRARASVTAGPAGWRVVDPSGAIGDGERWWVRLVGASVTAWSPSGKLGAIVGGELVILDVGPDGARVVSRAALDYGSGW